MTSPAMPKCRTCACMQSFYRLCDEHPNFRLRHLRIEQETSRRIAAGRLAATRPVRVIPVVVHVVHNRASDRISRAQVTSQIKVLNQDFRAANADRSKVPDAWTGLVGDTRIEFELTDKDPKGKETGGITYTQTGETSFSSDDGVKSAVSGGVAAWPADKYLNIWVCTLAGGLLGYAQFPGGPARTDGVVIRNTAFGASGTAAAPFDKGRTATHEIGHFLNLRHIWGDVNGCTGTDFVTDTPNAALPNTGKPAFPHITCDNGPHGDMFMNYMDYVDDEAMYMFTLGQVARMEATLAGPRKGLGYDRTTVARGPARKRRSRRA